jgi:cytochrome c-type biogenesis protein CcmF
VRRDGRHVTTLYPQKRIYNVQNQPMTQTVIAMNWYRDILVSLGEPLGADAWSMRIQYKPLVRFIWLGTIFMAIGGLVAVTDRRYRLVRSEAEQQVAAGGRSPVAGGG